MILEIEIEEGDILNMNERLWNIEDVSDEGRMRLRSDLGDTYHPDRDELQESLKQTGEIRLIKSDYIDSG